MGTYNELSFLANVLQLHLNFLCLTKYGDLECAAYLRPSSGTVAMNYHKLGSLQLTVSEKFDQSLSSITVIKTPDRSDL